MKKIICVLLSLCICFLFVSCNGGSANYKEEKFFLMDTVFTLRIYGDAEDVTAHFSAVLALLTQIDHALSKTHPASDVSRINEAGSAGDLSPHTEAVLKAAHDIMLLTDSAYLPTMGAITALWQKAGESNCLPDASELSAALSAAQQGFALEDGVCTLLGEGALLDLGGIGKGYAADCVLHYLREAGVKGALLSFGSSVAVLGEKGSKEPFTVGLRHPRDTTATVGTWSAPNGILSVSGDYERGVTVNGIRYHHVLDPQTGYPCDAGVASVAVLCENGAYSDALSTAFLVMGREKAEAFLAQSPIGAEAVFITAAGAAFSTTDSFVAK